MTTQLLVKDLSKVYDNRVRVLNHINLEIKEREFLVLVGPSGCGKSTLLRTIAGLEEASEGEIFIAGRDVTQLQPRDRNIAMVFQDYALYPHMTVRENLAFGLKMRGASEAEITQEIERAARILKIESYLDRKPAQLSGGQRQRVAIGRAIVRRASLFLFDEPLSNLDAKLRSQTRIELADLHQKIGATSVYVTHDQVEAMTLADRIVVLNGGDIQQMGSPLELYHKPANKFVASFIGSPAINFFDGTLRFEDGRRYFDTLGLTIDLSLAPTPVRPGAYTLGLRPEALKILAKEGRESQGTRDITVEVLLKEPHGHEVHMVVTLAQQQLIIRSANPKRLEVMNEAKRGDRLPCTFDREAMHWFEADETGRRIDELLPIASTVH